MELKETADKLIVIPNNKLLENDINKAFEISNKIMEKSIKEIAAAITERNLIMIALEDIEELWKGPEIAMIGMGKSDGENKFIDSMNYALNCPSLNIDLSSAKNALIIMTTDANNASLNNCEKTISFAIEKLNSDIDLYFGATIDESLEDAIQTIIIVSGTPLN